jgi:transaldolase
VSRFDTEADRRLQEIGTDDALELQGKLAVANARVAYGIFLETFSNGRFEDLAAKGANIQKPLWASTSTKNPAYPDLLYVESLVAKDTINTMPLETIDAYQDHGNPNPRPFDAVDIVRANDLLERMEEVGVSYEEVVTSLEVEGVEKFIGSWLELLERVEQA